ncbi:MAG: hypothetical protein NTZ92_04920 [Candidatus Omnitrophica bacterium]|nr:hypothetical protein [Candidatus Omnitrophota bacterium]
MNVNVPITVVDSAIEMPGSGSFAAGSIPSALMNINFYATNAAELSGIWAGLVSGSFTGTTSDTWSAVFNDSSNIVNFTGTQWSAGQWEAQVSGTNATKGTSMDGVASGTYSTGTTTFSGAATGAWTTPSGS